MIQISDLISAPIERRPVGDVSSLVDSIKQIGLLNPITVTAVAEMPGKFRLVAGAHRVEAAKLLGWSEIPANVVELDELHAELAIIDENLCRNELTALERGEQLARRKEIHETLFPETRNVNERGGPGRGKTAARMSAVSAPTFTEDTASKTGVSPRTVRRDVEIGTKIAPDVRNAIRDTPIADSKTDLLELARQTPEVQRRVVERVLGTTPTLNPAPPSDDEPVPPESPEIVARREKMLARDRARVQALCRKPADVRQTIREVRQEQRREEVAAKPAPAPETCPARVEVVDATKTWPLADGSVDLIVTSPPYGVGIGYSVGDVDPHDWIYFMRSWLVEAYRVADDTGRLCLNIPLDANVGGYRPIYADAVQQAISAGWKYRTSIVWEEGNVSRSIARGSVDSHAAVNVTCGDEMIAVFYKEDWAREDGQTADIPHESWLEWTNGHWKFGGESRAYDGHPAAYPEELARRLILLFSGRGATVLDPFCGSGTTPVVAHKLGRKAIGFDLDPQWVASTRRRVQEVNL